MPPVRFLQDTSYSVRNGGSVDKAPRLLAYRTDATSLHSTLDVNMLILLAGTGISEKNTRRIIAILQKKVEGSNNTTQLK